MSKMYDDCEGEYSCSLPMKVISLTTPCGHSSNYQEVYYKCGHTATRTTGQYDSHRQILTDVRNKINPVYFIL